MKTFDPTKPVQTRDGRKARIICSDRTGNYPIVALIGDNEATFTFTIGGRQNAGSESPIDLINIPDPPKLRPWRPEEVPVGAIIRGRQPLGTTMILSVDTEGVSFANALPSPTLTRIGFLSLAENYLHSTDGGKIWKPCNVEEVA